MMNIIIYNSHVFFTLTSFMLFLDQETVLQTVLLIHLYLSNKKQNVVGSMQNIIFLYFHLLMRRTVSFVNGT